MNSLDLFNNYINLLKNLNHNEENIINILLFQYYNQNFMNNDYNNKVLDFIRKSNIYTKCLSDFDDYVFLDSDNEFEKLKKIDNQNFDFELKKIIYDFCSHYSKNPIIINFLSKQCFNINYEIIKDYNDCESDSEKECYSSVDESDE